MKIYLILPREFKGSVSVKAFHSFRRFKWELKDKELKEEDLPKQFPGGLIGLVVEADERI